MVSQTSHELTSCYVHLFVGRLLQIFSPEFEECASWNLTQAFLESIFAGIGFYKNLLINSSGWIETKKPMTEVQHKQRLCCDHFFRFLFNVEVVK